MIKYPLILVVFGSISMTAQAEQDLNKLVEKSREYWADHANSISKKRYDDCLKAIGNSDFCTCLNINLPWALEFRDYINIITSEKPLTKDDQDLLQVFRSVHQTRNNCAK